MPLLHTPEDGARELHMSRSQFYELLAAGEIESLKIGRSRRIPHDALVAYVERLRGEQHRAADKQPVAS